MQCDPATSMDRLEVGGSAGLDSSNMEKSSTICGRAEGLGAEQAIFCGITTIRLISSGTNTNLAQISVRAADENDISLATLVCQI